MTILRKQNDVEEAKMADLVETYNALTGKAIKKFETIEIGRTRTRMAILAAEAAAGKAGVAKHEKPTAKTVEELGSAAASSAEAKPEVQAADPAADQPKEANMATKKTAAAKKAAAKKAPAKKAPAKKAATKKSTAPRHMVYSKVKYTKPDVERRPQEGSMRTKVLHALEKRKVATIEQLSEDVKFNARSFVHKLVGQGWAAVVPAA